MPTVIPSNSVPADPLKTHIETPSVPQLGDSGCDSGYSDTDNITSMYNPIFRGTAEAGSFVELLINGVAVDRGFPDADGNWQVRLADQADGVYSVTLVWYDAYGNISEPSAPLVMTIDTATPQADIPQLASQIDGVNADGRLITHDNTPIISGVTEAGAHVDLYDTGSYALIGSVVADGNGAWSVTSAVTSDGNHDLVALVTDTAGNSAQSSALHITVDTTAPETPAGPALDGYGTGEPMHTNLTELPLHGWVEAYASVALYDGATKIAEAVATEGGEWHIVTGTLAEGVHELTVTTTDQSGNTSAPSAAQIFDIKTHADAPATPQMADSDYDSGYSSTDNITQVYNPAFSGKLEAGSFVELSVDGVVVDRGFPDANGDWQVRLADMNDGVYSVTAVVYDSYGNVSEPSAPLVVTIDTTAPLTAAAPQLAPESDSGNIDGRQLTHDDTPVLTGITEAGAHVELFELYPIGGGIHIGSAVADANGAWSITSIALGDGAHNLVANISDVAGNSSDSAYLYMTVEAEAQLTLVGIAPV
jgi:hypothetical protein